MIESVFITAVTEVCDKHGVTIDNIDFDNRIINMSCDDPDAELKCAIELEDKLNQFAV